MSAFVRNSCDDTNHSSYFFFPAIVFVVMKTISAGHPLQLGYLSLVFLSILSVDFGGVLCFP